MTKPEKSRTLRRLREEAVVLLNARPGDHALRNDAEALVFMAKLHERGFDVDLVDAERCVERMRVAVQTGQYPSDLLSERNVEAEMATA